MLCILNLPRSTNTKIVYCEVFGTKTGSYNLQYHGPLNDILVTFEISKFPQRPFYFWC